MSDLIAGMFIGGLLVGLLALFTGLDVVRGVARENGDWQWRTPIAGVWEFRMRGKSHCELVQLGPKGEWLAFGPARCSVQ